MGRLARLLVYTFSFLSNKGRGSHGNVFPVESEDFSSHGLDGGVGMEKHIFKGLPVYDREAFAALEKMFNDHRGEILAALPWLAAELINEVDLKTGLEFIFDEGGNSFYIPNNTAGLSDKLHITLSNKLIDRIVYFSGSGGNIEIPSPWGVSGCIRRTMIRVLCQQKYSREHIRRIFGVSNRSIRHILRAR